MTASRLFTYSGETAGSGGDVNHSPASQSEARWAGRRRADAVDKWHVRCHDNRQLPGSHVPHARPDTATSIGLTVRVESLSFTLEQRRVKVDRATDAAALAPFKKQAHDHEREKEKSSLFWL